MPNRTFGGARRYGFNGKEKADEITSGDYDFGARIYDGRIGRWLSVDPLQSKYPDLSPYNFVANTPLNAVDPDGKEIIFIVRNSDGSVKEQLIYRNGNFWHADGSPFYLKGRRYNPGKENLSPTLFRVLTAYRVIENSNDEILKGQLHHLENSKLKHYVEKSEHGDNVVYPNWVLEPVNGKLIKKITSTQLVLDLDKKSTYPSDIDIVDTDLTIITHEMRHQYDYDIDNMGDRTEENNNENPAEIRATYNENRARKIQKIKNPRTTYGGKPIDPKLLKNPPNNKNPGTNNKTPETKPQKRDVKKG